VVAARAAVLLDRLVWLHVPDIDVGIHRTSTVGDVQELLVDRADGVVTLTVNRPQRKNAITVEMWARLVEIFDDIVERREDRVLVITGAADAFCSGADLSGAADANGPTAGTGNSVASMRTVGRAALRLHELPIPTIAVVNGVAAGAGCNLALGCDLVIASDRARFAEIFVKRGLALDFGGSWVLPRLIGLHRAKELAFLGDIIDAAEADRIGLVNRVVPHEQLGKEVVALAARLAAMPPLQLSVIKRQLNDSFDSTMAEAVEAEGVAQALMATSRDTAEAMLAFMQKREPRFTGE
jgi:enoyl-CoA hydratase/carnithine racemase